MPLIENEGLTPYLVYDAPINEKTRQIRKMFKVDENTGYPENYNWRPMARLGSEYAYTDPFEKLGEYKPEEYYCQKLTMVVGVVASCAGLHWFQNYRQSKQFYAGLHRFVGTSAAMLAILFWAGEKTMQRQSQKNPDDRLHQEAPRQISEHQTTQV